MNTYNRNLETGKIELHFEKAVYMALPEETKRKIKSNFLWSNYAGAWVSRAKNGNAYYAEQIAKELNLTFEGEKGEKLSFAEQVEHTQERAEERAERFEQRAQKAEKESHSLSEHSHKLLSVIPMGQPILVGHHSERGHRSLLAKADNAMRKSCEADDKAEYYEQRAKVASYTAEGKQFQNVNYLLNRISECKANVRRLDRYLSGIDLVSHETRQVSTKDNPLPISDNQREKWTVRKNEQLEKLDFFMTKLQEIGGGQLTAERLKEGKPAYVRIGREWYPLKSINRDTVTVLNWLGIAHFTWKFKFDEIKAMQSINGTVIVHDRDGNEVKPTIKYNC